MSKHRIETDLDELSEEILNDLDHKSRYGLLLKAIEEEHEHWRKRLKETTPKATYRGRDPEYIRWKHLMSILSVSAVSSLSSVRLEYQLAQSRKRYQNLFDACTADDVEIPMPDMLQHEKPYRDKLLKDLYLMYHTLQRFAEQIVGVDLETWVAMKALGAKSIEMAEMILDVYSRHVDQINDELIEVPDEIDCSKEGMPDELPEKPIDQLVLVYYGEVVDLIEEQLQKEWVSIGGLGL